jgi:hypothetical protein
MLPQIHSHPPPTNQQRLILQQGVDYQLRTWMVWIEMGAGAKHYDTRESESVTVSNVLLIYILLCARSDADGMHFMTDDVFPRPGLESVA